MIRLTRLNQSPLMVNSDLIKFVESAPDTVITLVSGEKIVVLENPDVLLERVVEFRRRLLDGLLFNGLSSPAGMTGNAQESPTRRRTQQEDEDQEQ
jgi:flagellar protein FlbD